ncbi:xanthine dehydrogenase family protein molybdopterin-binding subunit [Kineococcus glutinatus]|uniref:Xanthine dehydrogenase family protein molybdopterin-binding subunit n=1 Tax=Kineococcus glutinatus TaxID=1070872 RepID=A0ABP9I1S4_9ACTN
MSASTAFQPTRREDVRLLTGTGRYVADLAVDGCLEAAFVRSRLAHGRVRRVDAAPARAVASVVPALAAAALPGRFVVPPFGQPGVAEGRDWEVLAGERVRHVGQPLAVVLAADRYAAEDGADAVVVDVDPLPALVGPQAAAASDVQLFDGLGNVVVEQDHGEPVPQEVWAAAHVVVEATYTQQLLAPVPMESRAVLAAPDGAGGLRVWCSHQAPHRLRDNLGQALRLPPDRVRVTVPDAGGAFGSKSATFPEYLAVALLALRLGRPVRWVEDRAEAFSAHTHGRGQRQRVRLAADRDGRFLALDLDVLADLGAYPHVGVVVPTQTALMATGAYATGHVHARVRAVVTTTAPTAPYRGAGRPEAAYAVERTVEALARRLGADPVELRRRNFIAPERFPHTTPTGRTYDSGDYARALDVAVDALELDRWRTERARRRAEPGARPLGIGFCSYVERTGGDGPLLLQENGSVEALADGSFLARCGTSATGQGHETAFAQVVADALGVDTALVRAVDGDTGEVPHGVGSFASRSMQMGGAALHLAARELVDLARQRAVAWAAAAGPPVPAGSATWDAGRLLLPGGRWIGTGELVTATGELRADHVFRQEAAFPFGCYGAVVEVDPDTGEVEVLRLVAVDDYGTVVHPVITRGQTVGSLVQGLGQALYEEVPHDGDGVPLLAEGLFDYLLPTASEVPPFVLRETRTPNPSNPLGAKGAGEAGCIGVPPAVVNAVADALQLDDPDLLQMPLTPARVWRAARAAGAAS